ncbi:MAG TPA: HAD family hydrolase [Blastocatellia bacterium]|nr:HAD family hydrolase [Blastocatellia bacterium]
MNVDLLIFDLDGTLIDSKNDIAVATNLMLKDLGFNEVPLQTVVSFIGEGVRRLVERAVRYSSGKTDLNEPEVESAMVTFRRHYAEHLVDSTVLYPHVAETLEVLKPKKKAILTNKPFEFSDRILRMLSIRKQFLVVLGGDSLPVRKPAPEPIWHLLNHFQVAADRAVMIGDSRTDIDCGRAAGIATCGVSYGFRPRTELEESGAEIIIDDFSEVAVKFK